MKLFNFRLAGDRPNSEVRVIKSNDKAAILRKFGLLKLKGMPAVDQQSARQNIAMTHVNYAFMGGQFSWSQSASFSVLFEQPLKEGTPLRVTFPDQVFEGKLARRLCMWGDEEYLECPLPKNFAELVQGPYRRSLDVALTKRQQLVMTYTPTAVFVFVDRPYATNQTGDQQTVPDLLTNALMVEWLNRLPDIDPTDLQAMQACSHETCTEVDPDSMSSFLERTYTYCKRCGKVQAVSGRCARDACDCAKHDHNYKTAQVCVDW